MNETPKTTPESQLEVAIGLLLDSFSDKSQLVSETLNESIRKLARQHPNQVLKSCCSFYNPKLSNNHIASILKMMENICIEHILAIDGDTILLIIDFCMKVMIENQHETHVQMLAADILVALGRKHHVQVLEHLLNRLEAGTVPHFMVPHTLGALANVNAYGVVPYLKKILSIMLPMLGAVKTDPLRQAFAFAIGSFCEALIEYTSNIEQMPDNTITLESFTVEVGMAFDVFFASWLHSREARVLETVLSAVSSLYTLLTIEKVTQFTHRIIQVLLNFYKKHVNPFYVTKCLHSIIQKTASVDGTLLEPLLMNILHQLGDLVCVSPDYAQPDSLRNHGEALRCYECFALHFTDHTIDQLIGQLRNNNERERIKGILIITHLTSYSTENAIQRRLKDIVRQLSEMLNDQNIRVRKTLMKLIVAFACRGILLNPEITPEGPDRYMEFLLQLCCKPVNVKNVEIDTGELFDIQKSADNTLCMLSTSVPELESHLWDLLLKCFLSPGYDEAIVVLLRCLTHLASRKSTPVISEGAFVRSLTLLAIPLPGFRGTFLLNFLKHITPGKSDGYKSVWDVKIPQLMKYLEQNYDNFNQIEWHDLLCDFLNLLLENIKDETFNEELVKNAKVQLAWYNNNRYISTDLPTKQTEKHFLLKCIAIIATYIEQKAIVSETLDVILVNVKLTDFAELHACAEAVGICSRVHFQTVLDKLSSIRKDVLLKKTSKFSFIKDHKQELGTERVRYVIISSYTEVCNRAPADKLLQVIESEILDFVVNELSQTKDFPIMKICLKTIGSVADAMHPNRNSLHIRMLDRDKVLNLVASKMHLHSGPDYIELYPIIIPVITSLIKLPANLETDQRLKLLKQCFDTIFNASAIYCKITAEPIEIKEDSFYGDLKLAPFVSQSFTKVNQLVQELLLQNLNPGTLDEMVTLLESWLTRKKAEQRLPAVETLRVVLLTFLDNIKFAYDYPSSFGQAGFLIARIVPRITDPNKNIRKVSVECLCLVLCIASRYEGHMRDHDKLLTNALDHIQKQIDSNEPKLLYNLTCDIAHVICVNLPQFQLIHFVEGLMEALLDCEPSSSSGSSVVLNMTLKAKGSELLSHTGPILEQLITQLNRIKCARTRSSTLRAVLNFSAHHSKAAANIFLNQPLPLEPCICDCWGTLSTDQTLVLVLFEHMKKILKQTPLYEEQEGGEIKIANIQGLQVICAMHELLKNSQLKEICRHDFSELFSILFISFVSYIGVIAPGNRINDVKKFTLNTKELYRMKPAKIALDTMKLYLACCEFTETGKCLINLQNIDDLTEFLNVIEHLVHQICAEYPESLASLVSCLAPYIRSEFEPQRVATVVFFTHLIRERANFQAVLAENLLEMILDIQMDQCTLVKKNALKGLGFAAEYINPGVITRHAPQLLSVFMNNLNYSSIGNESDVILEAMLSFSKLLTALEGHKLNGCQVTAVVRIKPLLDQEDVALRKAAFQLLGDLSISLDPEVNGEAFKEQIQGDFITLLLHLCDPNLEVVRACKYTLRKVAPYLECPAVNSMIQKHVLEEGILQYADFVKDLVKIMADEMQELFSLFVMTSLSYLRSGWVEIRSNAAMMVGLLYASIEGENKQRLSLETICDKLTRLLGDESEEVRMRAVQAIVCLFIE